MFNNYASQLSIISQDWLHLKHLFLFSRYLLSRNILSWLCFIPFFGYCSPFFSFLLPFSNEVEHKASIILLLFLDFVNFYIYISLWVWLKSRQSINFDVAEIEFKFDFKIFGFTVAYLSYNAFIFVSVDSPETAKM